MLSKLTVCIATALLAALAGASTARRAAVSLAPGDWEATDSVRVEPHLGRQSLYIQRGVALARHVTLEDGTLEYDVAATRHQLHGIRLPGQGTAIHGGGLPACRAERHPRGHAVRARVPQPRRGLAGLSRGRRQRCGRRAPRGVGARSDRARGECGPRVLRHQLRPVLVVPRLAGSGGNRVGVWTGAYGRGAYYSNIRYTPSAPSMATSAPTPAPGTITRWELSGIVTPDTFRPEVLPDLSRLTWQPVAVEPEGFVLVNRVREQPNVSPPVDPKTREVLVDSVMTGRVAGSRIVYARATVDAPRNEVRRLEYCYSDGIVVYVNGHPVAFAMNPQYFRDDLGVTARAGDAVYVPLRQGRNEVVVASIELGGGWAFGVRVDPRGM